MYKISYIADGETSEFLFAFPIFQTQDVRVSINENLISGNTYGIVINEEFNGGLVVFSEPPTKGTKIDIFRLIVLSRVIDYQPTNKIDPEDLNTDFNFLLEAIRDIKTIDMDLLEWKNTHDDVKRLMDHTISIIEDKLSGGGVLGIYNNLLSVLDNALPKLINDYGSVVDSVPNENIDDYGLL